MPVEYTPILWLWNNEEHDRPRSHILCVPWLVIGGDVLPDAFYAIGIMECGP